MSTWAVLPPHHLSGRCGGGRGAAAAAASVLAASALTLATAGAAAAASMPTALRQVTFQGYRLQVPAAWPVIDLAAQPRACVRFDVHAVYLGTPGADENCPARVIGRTEALLVQPAARLTGAPAARPVLTSVQDTTEHQFTVTGSGVEITATYGTDAGLARNILASASLPTAVPQAAGAAVAPGESSRATAPAATPAASAPVSLATANYTGKGFDACTAPSSGAMSAWKSNSPYAAIGIYIGGAERGCAQPNLTAGWVSQQAAAGWHFIPLYVGLQASQISSAASQGTSAADDAASHASGLGLGLGTPVYYDMEAYSSSFSAAVLSFLSAWTDELHKRGYESGVYSSSASGVADLAGHYSSDTMPDVIYDALWNGAANTSDPVIGGGDWSTRRRVHQYQGGHDETYGGVAINIDNDYLDVRLPYGGTRQASQAAAQSDGTVDVFYRGTNGDLEHEFFTGSSWSGPVTMGSAGVVGEPSVTTSAPGTVDVFWEGTNGHLWHQFFTPSGGWSTQQDMGMGPLGAPPHAVAQQNGTIDVFWKGTGTSPSLWHAWFNPGKSWAGPQDLGGTLASDPSPVTSSDGTVDVFFKGTDASLWHVFFSSGGSWHAPASLGMGPLGAAPHAAGQLDGTIDVVWQGTGTSPGIWHAGYTASGGWSGSENLGGAGDVASDPFPVTSSPGTVDVFFQGTDGNLWHVFHTGGWSAPASLGMGTLGGAPFASAEISGTIDVFWKGSGAGSLWHAWFNPGKPWAGPQDLGGSVG